MFERAPVEVDAQDGGGSAVLVAEHRADRGEPPAVGQQLRVGAVDVGGGLVQGVQFAEQRGVARPASAHRVPDGEDLVAGGVVQHHLGVGPEQQGDRLADGGPGAQARVGGLGGHDWTVRPAWTFRPGQVVARARPRGEEPRRTGP